MDRGKIFGWTLCKATTRRAWLGSRLRPADGAPPRDGSIPARDEGAVLCCNFGVMKAVFNTSGRHWLGSNFMPQKPASLRNSGNINTCINRRIVNACQD
jgi:hypothetical protein